MSRNSRIDSAPFSRALPSNAQLSSLEEAVDLARRLLDEIAALVFDNQLSAADTVAATSLIPAVSELVKRYLEFMAEIEDLEDHSNLDGEASQLIQATLLALITEAADLQIRHRTLKPTRALPPASRLLILPATATRH